MKTPCGLRGTVAAVALALLTAACSSSDDCSTGAAPLAAPIAVLGAMPSELAPLVARAQVDEVQVVDGKAFHVGTLGGVRVVLAMTGIGMLNSTATTRAVLEHFAVRGVVFSGVAGSPHRIADVTVPLTWSEPGGASYPADEGWLEAARRVASSGAADLEECTLVPPDDPEAELVCMPFEPAIWVSGRGQSSDPFGGQSVICRPGGGDVFGCDPALPAGAAAQEGAEPHAGTPAPPAQEEELTVDMETAAAARETAAEGLPFLAFRAVSDGAEDPLGLPGFPTQFFAYYRLAAENAAIATTAFLEEIAATEAVGAASCD